MAAGLGPAWPQLSPLQPGTGQQGVFTFGWDLGAWKSLQMSFVHVGCAVRPCKQEGAGHGFGATQLCVWRAGFGQDLPFGFMLRAGLLNSKTCCWCFLFLIHPAHPQAVLPSHKSSPGSAQACFVHGDPISFPTTAHLCLSFPSHKSC